MALVRCFPEAVGYDCAARRSGEGICSSAAPDAHIISRAQAPEEKAVVARNQERMTNMSCSFSVDGEMVLGRIDCAPQPVVIPAQDLLGAFSEQKRLQKENEVLRALLAEWHEMFVPVRRNGTEGAALIDRTAKAIEGGFNYVR